MRLPATAPMCLAVNRGVPQFLRTPSLVRNDRAYGHEYTTTRHRYAWQPTVPNHSPHRFGVEPPACGNFGGVQELNRRFGSRFIRRLFKNCILADYFAKNVKQFGFVLVQPTFQGCADNLREKDLLICLISSRKDDETSSNHQLSRAPARAAEPPNLSMPGAAPGRLANFMGSWQTSNALALQASSYGGGTHRLHHFTAGNSTKAQRTVS